MKYFTPFGTDKGPDVGYPTNINDNFGAEQVIIGEADPSYFNPLDTNKNLLDGGITDNSIWGIQFGQAMPSNLL
jgi:hypothetical protein